MHNQTIQLTAAALLTGILLGTGSHLSPASSWQYLLLIVLLLLAAILTVIIVVQLAAIHEDAQEPSPTGQTT